MNLAVRLLCGSDRVFIGDGDQVAGVLEMRRRVVQHQWPIVFGGIEQPRRRGHLTTVLAGV